MNQTHNDRDDLKDASVSRRTLNALQHIDENWHLVERYCERYPNDWRLVFKRDDEILEVQVPEEVWRAFDA